MRMHSYSKCSPNLVVGALLIFSIIVLYNYWNISTLNRELIIKINTLEKQVISFSKANEGLQSALDKTNDEKNKVQLSLQQEEMQGRDLRDRIAQKERQLKDVQTELDTTKQDAQNCHDESGARETKCQSKDKEISDLKEKITNLEAQTFEKTSIAEKLEGELSDAKSKIEELQKELVHRPTPSTDSKGGSKPAPAPVAQPDEQINQDQEPVLLNDPAVPYPDGWMDKKFSQKHSQPKVSVQDVDIGLKGIKNHKGPVILFDDPASPRKTAKYSVLQPPQLQKVPSNDNRYALQQPPVVNNPQHESQMNPQTAQKQISKEPQVLEEPLKQPEGGKAVEGGEEADKELEKDLEPNAARGEDFGAGGGELDKEEKEDKEDKEGEEGEKESPGDGAGVLPIPDSPKVEKSENQQQAPQHAANLDAQEDDKDRQLKDDAVADDQSPDGALSPNEKKDEKEENQKENVAPIPQILKPQDPPAGAASGQDARENAHLTNNNL